MFWNFEHTDTFGGQANYSWVERGQVEAETVNSAVIRVKRKLGLTGVPCKRSDYGDMIELVPRNSCTVVFLSPHYGENAKPED